MPFVRLAMVQSNPVVGDISGNVAKVMALAAKAANAGANLVQFGEMSITGYPVEDLVTRKSFVLEAELAVTSLAEQLVQNGLGDLAVVIGAPRIVG
jgi:NAD+ synthase (glutamine-hydrolysing)